MEKVVDAVVGLGLTGKVADILSCSRLLNFYNFAIVKLGVEYLATV